MDASSIPDLAELLQVLGVITAVVAGGSALMALVLSYLFDVD